MPIELHCNHCGKLVRAPDEAAGKHGTCPACHQSVYIPTPDDRLEVLGLEPVDPDFERRKKQLARETANMAARVLRDREGLGPEKPGDRAERMAAAERAAASASAAPKPVAANPQQVMQWVIGYAAAVAGGNLPEAERLEEAIRGNLPAAQDAIQRILVDEIPPAALSKIPRPVLVGIFKKLRELK